MRSVILLILAFSKICTSSVLFRITSNNENVSINSSYFFGTVHVPHNLVWPYLSNETLRLINESNQMWFEHDFTDPEISKYIYGCSMDKMSIKQRASLRAKSWSKFLNETKGKSDTESNKSNNLELWRQWFVQKEFLLTNYLWRNKTITDDMILDHRIILEAYQRGAYVGSLETIPNDCFMVENSKNNKKSAAPNVQLIMSRAFNCDMIGEDFVKELLKGLDFNKMIKRNQQITEHIRKLLKNDPQQSYVFVVGAAHLFGNISIVQMLQDQYNNDYYIKQIDAPSPNFPYQTCTDEEFSRLVNATYLVQNKTTTKRFFNYELLI